MDQKYTIERFYESRNVVDFIKMARGFMKMSEVLGYFIV